MWLSIEWWGGLSQRMNRVCMWWHSSCSSLIFKILLFGRYNLHNIGWLVLLVRFRSLTVQQKRILLSGHCFKLFAPCVSPALCPDCAQGAWTRFTYCLHHTEYSTSSESKAIKKPRMVRNITLLAVSTRPHAPPSIWGTSWLLGRWRW